MKLFVSQESIHNSVNYFKNLSINKPEQLGLFFFLKSLNFNSMNYKPFKKAGNLTREEKEEYLLKLYKLAGLFDKEAEQPGKRTCLFPFSINNSIGNSNYYNGGSIFPSLISRLRDTIDNTIVDKFLKKDDSNNDNFKFNRNYIDFLKTEYLNQNKISIAHFAAWYFRFRDIECPDTWNSSNVFEEDFTRVCCKILIEELNLNEQEKNQIFFDDITLIKYNDTKLTGPSFRNMLTFTLGAEPEIFNGGSNFMAEERVIDLETSVRLAEVTGKNLSKNEVLEILKENKQVVLYGPPGTGKSHITKNLNEHFEKSIIIQFHPSTTYEQFIGGYSVNKEGKIISKPGKFLSFCEEAKATEGDYLVIIDELNRGNLPNIFGETILALDRGYEVELLQPIAKNDNEEITKFSIPNNVYILATMNSSDRSIALVDYAIRRRFAFIKFQPNYEFVESISLYDEYSEINVTSLYKEINRRIFQTLKDEDLLLGHTYFYPKWAIDDNDKIHWNVKILNRLMNFYIIPIINEYTYGNKKYLQDILGNELINNIYEDESFIRSLKSTFSNCVNEG